MNKINVAVLNCKEAVYPQPWLNARIDEFMKGLRQCGSMRVISAYEVNMATDGRMAEVAASLGRGWKLSPCIMLDH